MGRHIIGRIVVFSVNFSLWLSGILLIVFGSIGVADEQQTVNLLNLIDGVSSVTNIIDVTQFVQGTAIFMIVLGSFLFLLGWNGCHGIMRKSKKSICVYWILLLGAIMIELALIIYAAVYPSSAEDTVKKEMYKSLNSTYSSSVTVDSTGKLLFAPEGSELYSWQVLEFETTCCGAYNRTDYTRQSPVVIFPNTTQYTFPLSCCTLKKKGKLPSTIGDIAGVSLCQIQDPAYINKDGCWNTVYDMMYEFNLIGIIISSCLIGAELVGVIFAARLWKDSDD